MKLLKYVFFIIILLVCIVFIIQLNEMNTVDQLPIKVKIPYISSIDPSQDGIKVWEAIILSITIGVFIGFLIALFQLISQKTEIISLNSKIRRLKNELNSLRNQAIEDNVDIKDELDNSQNL